MLTHKYIIKDSKGEQFHLWKVDIIITDFLFYEMTRTTFYINYAVRMVFDYV